MAGKEVKLLGFWVSSYSHSVEWALRLKGIEYEYIEEDIFNKSSLLLELNPVHKKVPVLVHDGKVIVESLLIIEYIDETWKGGIPLFPQDPYERAMARFWAKFAGEKLGFHALSAMSLEGEMKETNVKSSREALERIEGEIKGKKFFGGETMGYLDLAVGWISYWLPVWEEVGSMKIFDPLKYPAIASWMNNFINHPAIKDKLPPRDEMVPYFHNRRKYLNLVACALASSSHMVH